MSIFAVINSITQKSIQDCNLLEAGFVINHLSTLESMVFAFIKPD